MKSALESYRAFVKRVHAFRIPLSKRGRIAMGFVYVSIPVVGAHYLMKHLVYPKQEETTRMLARRRLDKMDAGLLPENEEERARLEHAVETIRR